MLLVEGFQKFAGIPFGISRIFESLMPQQISANRHKNRSIQVLPELRINPKSLDNHKCHCVFPGMGNGKMNGLEFIFFEIFQGFPG
jgi:hypothetical protein